MLLFLTLYDTNSHTTKKTNFFPLSLSLSLYFCTATVSLLMGETINVITTEYPDITGPEVGVTLALFAGIVLVVIGIVRLGLIVDFIPGPAIG